MLSQPCHGVEDCGAGGAGHHQTRGQGGLLLPLLFLLLVLLLVLLLHNFLLDLEGNLRLGLLEGDLGAARAVLARTRQAHEAHPGTALQGVLQHPEHRTAVGGWQLATYIGITAHIGRLMKACTSSLQELS